MKMNSMFTAAAAGLTASLFLNACSSFGLFKSLDVVGKQSIASFEEVLTIIPDNVKTDEENAGWSLWAPDQSVRFIWSGDYSKSPLYDVMLEFDARPFLDAGLEPAKLPEAYVFYGEEAMGDKLLKVGRKLGKDQLAYKGEATALGAYEQLVNKYRSEINYHAAMDHYGVKLSDGNLFEWAKDMELNAADGSNQEKDIVFVLNPEPLVAAGLDPEQVEGWTYTQVPVEEDGKMVQVWKLLKAFDLK